MRTQATYQHYIDPSEMDRSIDLIAPATDTRTSGGSWVKSEGTTTTVRAKLEWVSVNENLDDDQVGYNEKLKVTVRNQGLDNLTTRYKMRYNSDTYNITGIREKGRQTFLELICDLVDD